MTLRFQSSSAIKNILSGSNCTEFQHFKFISIASYTCVVAKMSKTKDDKAGPPGEVKKVNLDDQGALNGLRGYAAFYILVFHAVLFSDLSTHLHASVHMPLFFLLSGFCLTLAYGGKSYRGFDTCCGPCRAVDTASYKFFCCGSCNKKSVEPEEGEAADALPVVFDSWKFYRNRFSRILPVYWLCIIFALPLIFLGYDHFKPENYATWIPGLIEAWFGISTMVIIHGFGPNGAGWTVCTLSVFYWFFPNFLVRAQRWSNKKLTWAIVVFFWLQVVIGVVIFNVFDWTMGYWESTANPFFRFPIFLMGVCGGLLVHRKREGENLEKEGGCFYIGRSNWFVKAIYDKLPWINFCSKKDPEDDLKPEDSQQSWKNRVDINMFSYNLALLVLTILHGLYTKVFDYWEPEAIESGNDITDDNDGDENEWEEVDLPIEAFVFKHGLMNTYLQFFFVHLQLMMIIGLCCDGGRSYTSRFFRTKVMQFLGRISMALYLVHGPLIGYINCCINGPLTHPSERAKYEEVAEFGRKRGLRVWAVPIHIIVSILLRYLLTIFVEEPAKNYFRKLDARRSENRKIAFHS